MTKIEVRHNKKMGLKIPEFTCDGGLAPHLDKYDMLKHLNGFFFTGLIGKPGSGKTSMLVSWLTGKKKDKIFRKVFDHVLSVMPTSSRESMKKNIFKNHHQNKMFDELDYKTISNIYNQLEGATEQKETTLLILDDVGASLKNKEIQTLLRKIIYNRRHLKVHIVILLQSYMSIPKEIRKLFSNIIMFKPSKIEMENLMEEQFEMHKDTALDLMNYSFNDRHDYLFLNIESQRIYKDFDEIIVHSNDSQEYSDDEK
jgi:DNA replication protein DnaC